MTFILLEHAPARLRGILTRWMIEPHPNVFVGQINARVREKLFAQISKQIEDGAFIMIYEARNEQGFSIRTVGHTKFMPIDFDGLYLVASRE
ncbi:MAG: type I-E CRISPR-associated endoribonuclease Cas2e [Roseiflexaceae bacterium]|jgi:CRISPR-associated protein Cas2